MDWYFYALLCADGTYYAGVTTDLRRRLHEHNKTRKGAKYTRTRRPVNIVYSTRYASRSEAQKAEAAFKKLSRDQKQNVIQGWRSGGDEASV